MKNLILFIFTSTILMVSCASSTNVKSYGWEKLGAKSVSYKIDKDIISVTAREGKFNAIRLNIKNAPLNMHKCVVHFANGETQNVAMKKNFSRGSKSRVIDLKKGQRIISKVVFWYDTKNYTSRRATVELWGRH